ncbi:MAG TPA: PfkB family carbohydrate kinase [Syntrophorhabdaceae bacterium]|nr:PfkB family carbohydrate kinase [Syntrophorhabdaceae bacterium]
MNSYDLLFIGHITIDEIEADEGSARGVPGGAPFFGALAAACSRKRIAVVTRMAKEDENFLAPLSDAGIDVYLQPVSRTTHMRVVHPTANVDERLMYQASSAGFFTVEGLPPLEPCLVHLGGLTDREFTMEFIRGLKKRGFRLSVDMQDFVRQVDIETGVVHFRDVPEKRDIASIADMVKLDMVEAEILTGVVDLEQAAMIVERWGCPEIIITRSDGVLARYRGRTYFERYSNRNSRGRTGRGDTTTGSYLARRLDHEVEDSLKFAAALVSIKMETPGPFSGTMDDVLRRMNP